MDFFGLINTGARFGRVLFRTPSLESSYVQSHYQPMNWCIVKGWRENVYFSCALMRKPERGRGGVADAMGITMLWLDLDIADDAHKSATCPTREQAELILAAYPVPPSIIIHSGHGLHCYWLLNEPWMFTDDADRQEAAEFMRGWQGIAKRAAAAMGKSVDSTHDLARVLRVPNTINHKGGQEIRVTTERMEDVRYSLETLRPHLILDGPASPIKTPSARDACGSVAPAKVRTSAPRGKRGAPAPKWNDEDDFDSFIIEIAKMVGL